LNTIRVVILPILIFSAAVLHAGPVERENLLIRYLNADIDAGELRQLLDRTDLDPVDRAYISYMTGLAELRAGNKRRAERALVDADRIVSNLEIRDSRSDLLRLNSEIRAQLMLVKGLFYIISHAASVEQMALAALEIDPRDVIAAVVVAQGRVNAPPAFGGNFEEGMSMLEELISRDDLTPSDEFVVLTALVTAEQIGGNNQSARRYARRALELFPRNPEMRDTLADIP
jgi:hypothetical protein